MQPASLPPIDTARVAIVGLGYVGLPLAVAFAATRDTLGFDVDPQRVDELRKGLDRTGETDAAALRAPRLRFDSDPETLAGHDVFVVTVPTPVDAYKRPDFSPLEAASRTVGRVLRPGNVVIFESTVYPGATEERCVPIIERESDLVYRRDFHVGYSPERINPGDQGRRLPDIVKVTSGSCEAAAGFVDALYRDIVPAGTHRASSIRVAEAAKVIENIQRDVNIALMNELALILDRLGIDTVDVLEAAGTKWNFLPFRPGLVGGHCIGVDPYYLTHKAEMVGHLPEIILAGRREAAFRDAEAREREAEAEAKATQMVSDAIAAGNPQALNYFIAQKYTDAVQQFATSPNAKTILFPVEATQLIGTLGGIGQLAKEALGDTPTPPAPPAAPRRGPFGQSQG